MKYSLDTRQGSTIGFLMQGAGAIVRALGHPGSTDSSRGLEFCSGKLRAGAQVGLQEKKVGSWLVASLSEQKECWLLSEQRKSLDDV